jgi:hypothetical protein
MEDDWRIGIVGYQHQEISMFDYFLSFLMKYKGGKVQIYFH